MSGLISGIRSVAEIAVGFPASRGKPRAEWPGRLLVLGLTALLGGATGRAQMSDLISRRGIAVQGEVAGELRLLQAGAVAISAGAVVRGDALLPSETEASPPPRGGPTRIATAATLSNPGGAQALRGKATGAPGFDLPPAFAVRPARGTRARLVDGSDQGAGDFSTVSDLTVRNNYQMVTVPAGAYGRLLVDGGKVQLGVAGQMWPTRYDFTSLEIRNHGRLDLVGPVVITVGQVAGIDGVIGRPDLPSWLDLRVGTGSMAVGPHGKVFGAIFAPNSAVSLASGAMAEGWVACDTASIAPGGRFKAARPDFLKLGSQPRAPSFPQSPGRQLDRPTTTIKTPRS